jgi:hypothetical protein
MLLEYIQTHAKEFDLTYELTHKRSYLVELEARVAKCDDKIKNGKDYMIPLVEIEKKNTVMLVEPTRARIIELEKVKNPTSELYELCDTLGIDRAVVHGTDMQTVINALTIKCMK